MHPSFKAYVEALHPAFEQLTAMSPTKISLLGRPPCAQCVYLFSEEEAHLYVGRTRRFRQRMREHSIDAAQHNQAVFAFKLAREATGMTTATYSQEGSRKSLMQLPEFALAFLQAKQRIRKMDLRFVEETDSIRQALLEMYVAVALRTPYNDFDTH